MPSSFSSEIFFSKIEKFLEIMHEEQLVFHRDIHEGNIMVESQTGHPYLIDFGNSIKFPENDRNKIKNKEIDPYKLITKVKGEEKEFNLQDDFIGLMQTKQKVISFLTK